MKSYSLGEIFRLGLVKNREGKPYTNKGSVSKYLKRRGVNFKFKNTPWGTAKLFKI